VLRSTVSVALLLSLLIAPPDVPVAAFGKFFLTLPLARFQTDLYVEMVGLVKPGDGADFDMVQLYR